MPIPDDLWDRFKHAFIQTSSTDARGNPGIRSVPIDSNGNSAQMRNYGAQDGNAANSGLLTMAFPQLYNGATFDRMRGGPVADVAAATGFVNALLVGQHLATPPTITGGQFNQLQLGSRGSLRVELRDFNSANALFPNVAAAADAYANPTITHIGADLMGFGGTTWDRIRAGDVNNVAAATGLLNSLMVGRYDSSLPTLTSGRWSALQLDSRGRLDTTMSGVYSTGPNGDGLSANNVHLATIAVGHLFNGSTIDRLRSVVNAANSTGTGIVAAGLLAQLDDASPTTITENQFGNVRMSAARALLTEAGGYSLGRATADASIKGSAGFIHSISIAPLTATPTAGLLTVYDNTAESGTVVYAEWVFATTPGHTVILDLPCGTGIFVGFDGTLANVQVTVAYR